MLWWILQRRRLWGQRLRRWQRRRWRLWWRWRYYRKWKETDQPRLMILEYSPPGDPNELLVCQGPMSYPVQILTFWTNYLPCLFSRSARKKNNNLWQGQWFTRRIFPKQVGDGEGVGEIDRIGWVDEAGGKWDYTRPIYDIATPSWCISLLSVTVDSQGIQWQMRLTRRLIVVKLFE